MSQNIFKELQSKKKKLLEEVINAAGNEILKRQQIL